MKNAPNDRAKSEGTINRLHRSVWLPPHSFNTGVKRDPIPFFKFLGFDKSKPQVFHELYFDSDVFLMIMAKKKKLVLN